jgi:hypothetical protein
MKEFLETANSYINGSVQTAEIDTFLQILS